MLLQKLNNFDSLRDNILQLQEKLLDLQCRADDSQKALIQKEKRRAQKNISKIVSKDEDNPNDTTEVDDKYCPPGWKCYLRDYSAAISTEKKQKVFYTPEGRFCISRDKALRYIEVSGDDVAQEDKDLLRRGLFSDGWSESEHLPEGWLMQVRQYKSKYHYFLTQDYVLLSGKKHALRHLLSKYSDSDLLKFFKHFVFRSDKESDIFIKYRTAIPYPWRAFEIMDRETKTSKLHYLSPDGSYHTTRAQAIGAANSDSGLSKANKEAFTRFISKVRPKTVKTYPNKSSDILTSKTSKRVPPPRKKHSDHIWSEDDSSLPPGWKVATETDGRKVFKDDTGYFYQSRRLAVKSMFQTKERFTDSEFDKMKACLVEDGFKPASFLPSDWLYKTGRREEKYISGDFNMYKSFEDVLGGLKRCGVDEEQINHFKRNCPRQWRDGGERLPDGWMSSTTNHYKGVKMETFLSPEGKFYQGIINALQQSYTTLSAGEREKLHSILLENGWVRDDLTPKGWLCKRYTFAEKSKVQWLSPEYQRYKL